MPVFDAGKVLVGDKQILLKKFNGSGELNIYPQVKSFDIFEDLDSFTVAAEFYITDGIELMNNFPLGGEETISLSLQTPTKGVINYEFMIDSITGMKTNDAGNLRTYMLRCVTKDFLRNSSMVYTKRYTDKKYDAAVSDVLNEMGADIPLITTEVTSGIFDYVINAKRPFQVIDVIKERAVSGEGNASSTFVFYQDNRGYHFQTIEKLIKDRKSKASSMKYEYRTGQRSLDIDQNVNAWEILAYETMNQGNQVQKTAAGAMRNQIRQFDIFRGTYYETQEYINKVNHKDFTKIDEGIDLNSPDFNTFTQEMPGISRMAVKDSLRPEMEHNNNIHYQRPFVERMSQTGLRIRVYGNTGIRVGDVVEINMPEISGLTRAPKKVEIFSNNYMITALKHRLDKGGNNDFTHTMIYELRKPDQYGRSLG